MGYDLIKWLRAGETSCPIFIRKDFEMSRYIDQDALCEFARHSTIGIDANDIMRFPISDVVEIVRCKDCKHYNHRCCHLFDGLPLPMPDDYCSYAERKESNDKG